MPWFSTRFIFGQEARQLAELQRLNADLQTRLGAAEARAEAAEALLEVKNVEISALLEEVAPLRETQSALGHMALGVMIARALNVRASPSLAALRRRNKVRAQVCFVCGSIPFLFLSEVKELVLFAI